ncbi:FtsX-like permease family protein [Mucilaginibacter sp. AW1-3]
MLKNYFKTAWRSLMRFKVFTLINILGLAIGISASMVIYLIVHYDFTFDKFENDNARIYRVVSDMKFSGNPYHNSGVPAPVGEAVRNELSGISLVSAFHQHNSETKVIIPGNTKQPLVLKNQGDIIFADVNYFKLIPYEWIAGSANTALNDPLKVVLTEKSAKLYFPDLRADQVIGRQVIYDSVATTVTGVVKTLSRNTDFIFHDFISLSTIPATGLKKNYSWGNWGMTNGSSQLYVKLNPGITKQQIEKQLAGINTKYVKKHKGFESAFNLQPLSDVHFNADYRNYNGRLANKPTLYGLLIVAAFLLLLGSINFINLSTAHASQRAKEIGIRKTMGSTKAQLILQFLSETFLITLLATILSIILAPVLLSIFSGFIPKDLHFNLLHQPDLIMFMILLVVTVSVLSGFYPSWVLSRYNPILVLKNQAYANTGKTRRVWIRKSLTIFQFLIAQFFIMGTFLVAKQIHYTLNKDLGFKKDAIITLSTPFSKQLNSRFVLLNKLKSIPGIELVSLGGNPPATMGANSGQVSYKDGKKEIQLDVQFKYGDPNYLKLYHLKLLAGTNTHESDTVKEVIVNETYAHMIGFKNATDAVGKTLDWSGVKLPIVGVMRDFNQESLHSEIRPLMFTGASSNSYELHVALGPENADGTAWKNTIDKIGKAYKDIYPEEDFDYDFYDKRIEGFYHSEQQISSLLTWATGLAIFISCLGLLGLVIYTTNLRTKEIGIRKVLGASVANLVAILSTDFIKLVLMSFIIALPVAWYAMNKWLQNFAYRTSINWWIFALSGALMILIALATLSFQTVKAAIANPVNSLKNE